MRTLTLTDPALIAPKVPTYGAVVAALSPIAYWPMQETSGTTMTAVTGTNGTYNGPVLTAGVGPVASLPNAPIFDGVNDYASAALDLSAYSTVSVAFWLWWDSYGTGDDLALEHTANANYVNAFQIDPDDPYNVFVIGQTGTSVGYRHGQITRPSAAAWHHYRFVLRRDGNLPKCTVDGVVQTVGNRFSYGTVSGTFTNSTLYVMSRAGASLFGDGRMVGLAVFPGEVSDADAARLAAAT